jgi:signal recognition particle GTPase
MPDVFTFNDLSRQLTNVLQNGSPILEAADYPMIRQIVALIGSLTEEEREKPVVLLDSPSRLARAVHGSGTPGFSPESLRQLLDDMTAFTNECGWWKR